MENNALLLAPFKRVRHPLLVFFPIDEHALKRFVEFEHSRNLLFVNGFYAPYSKIKVLVFKSKLPVISPLGAYHGPTSAIVCTRVGQSTQFHVHCQTLRDLQFKFVILVMCERECFTFRSVRNVISVFKHEELLIAVSEVNRNEIIRL